MFSKLIHNEDGVVLVIVMMILMATVMLGMASMMIASMDIRISGNYRDSVQVFFAAEAGIERSIAALRADKDWIDGFTYSGDTTLANASQYEV